jgi:hypothetical protein
LRSFRLRTEIKEENSNNEEITSTNNIIKSNIDFLVPPFQTIGFLESKWFEIIKELVEYGNKNILGNFKLYLVMEDRRQEENNNNHNQSWFRPRDKSGRFIYTYTSQL